MSEKKPQSFILKKPCHTCPFRKANIPFLTADRIEQLRAQIGGSGNHTHQCHSTYETHKSRSDFPICNGYLNMSHASGDMNYILEFAALTYLFGPEHLTSRDLVYANWDEMLQAAKEKRYAR